MNTIESIVKRIKRSQKNIIADIKINKTVNQGINIIVKNLKKKRKVKCQQKKLQLAIDVLVK